MTSITVTTQAELDAALAKHKKDPYAEIIIDSPLGVLLEVHASGSATVHASGSATVRASDSATVTAFGSATVRASDSATVHAFGSATVRASDSATVHAFGSATVHAFGSATVHAFGSSTVTASDSATVTASDSATVHAFGSATVRASDSATVHAFGSATVHAFGSATVHAFGSSTVTASDSATVTASDSATVHAFGSATVTASPHVAVHLHSARVTVEGGVVIDITKLDRTDWRTWAEYWGVEISGTELIVYKAVDDNLKSGRGFAYPIGETVEAPDWETGDFCGSGLHLSPRPTHALQYFSGATRYLECAVNVDEITVINGNGAETPKLKAKRVRVIGEVNIDGDPIKKGAEK